MKIKLINPKIGIQPHESKLIRRYAPPLGLLQLATSTPGNHQVKIVDENIEKIDFDEKVDLVGITCNVNNARRAYKIATRFKTKGTQVILGGPHPTAMPEEAAQFVDAVCIGEADRLWSEILKDAGAYNLKEKYYSPITNVEKHKINSNWFGLDQKKYLYTNLLFASKGCPYNCSFCYNSCQYINNNYRTKTLEDIIEEIKSLKSKQVRFIDDNLFGNFTFAKEFLKELKNLNIEYHCATTSNIVHNSELLDLMAESGCKNVFIGFESINQDSVQFANKNQNKIELYERLIKELALRRINLNASFIFGFDQDKPSVFRHTFNWLQDNKVKTLNSHILTPYPGTKLFEKLKNEYRITDYNWNNYDTAHVVFEPKEMTQTELLNGYRWINKKFYSTKSILKRLPRSSSQKVTYLKYNLLYKKMEPIVNLGYQLGFGNLISRIAKS